MCLIGLIWNSRTDKNLLQYIMALVYWGWDMGWMVIGVGWNVLCNRRVLYLNWHGSHLSKSYLTVNIGSLSRFSLSRLSHTHIHTYTHTQHACTKPLNLTELWVAVLAPTFNSSVSFGKLFNFSQFCICIKEQSCSKFKGLFEK